MTRTSIFALLLAGGFAASVAHADDRRPRSGGEAGAITVVETAPGLRAPRAGAVVVAADAETIKAGPRRTRARAGSAGAYEDLSTLVAVGDATDAEATSSLRRPRAGGGAQIVGLAASELPAWKQQPRAGGEARVEVLVSDDLPTSARHPRAGASTAQGPALVPDVIILDAVAPEAVDPTRPSLAGYRVATW